LFTACLTRSRPSTMAWLRPLLSLHDRVWQKDFNAKAQRSEDAKGFCHWQSSPPNGEVGSRSQIRFLPLRLCNAIFQFRSFLRKLFHHEEREGHEVLKRTTWMVPLRVASGSSWRELGCGSTALRLWVKPELHGYGLERV
jgi:hypothetical protein